MVKIGAGVSAPSAGAGRRPEGARVHVQVSTPVAPARRWSVRAVPFDDPAAAALRDAMSAEMRLRYWDRIGHRSEPHPGMVVTVEDAAWTGLALDEHDRPVGHVMLRPYPRRWLPVTAPPTVELKRMYVAPSHRGAGVAAGLVRAVDRAAAELGAGQVVLQTGDRQPDAVRLYERLGYHRVPLFEPYLDLTYSHCFAKALAPGDVTPG